MSLNPFKKKDKKTLKDAPVGESWALQSEQSDGEISPKKAKTSSDEPVITNSEIISSMNSSYRSIRIGGLEVVIDQLVKDTKLTQSDVFRFCRDKTKNSTTVPTSLKTKQKSANKQTKQRKVDTELDALKQKFKFDFKDPKYIDAVQQLRAKRKLKRGNESKTAIETTSVDTPQKDN